jgi:O-antigen ligase
LAVWLVVLWISPAAALAIGLTLPLGLVLSAWPDLATYLLVFLLYANVPVVAVKYHGVPYLAGMAVPLLLAVPLIHLFFVQHQRVIIDRVTCWIVAFVAIQFTSLVFCADPGYASPVMIGSVVEGLALYVLLVNVVRTPRVLRSVTWSLLAAGSLMGALTGYQYATRTFANPYAGFAQLEAPDVLNRPETAAQGPRQAGPIGEVNRYAQVMLMLVPLAYFCFRAERAIAIKALALTAMLLTMLGPALASSRGAGVGFLLMLCVLVAMRYLRVLHFGLILGAGLLILLAVPRYAERLHSLVVAFDPRGPGISQADSSIRGRITEGMVAVLMYAEHPVLGVGPGMYSFHYAQYAERVGGRLWGRIREPHSLLLGIAAESGTLGLAAFLGVLGTAISGLIRARRRALLLQPQLADLTTGYLLAIVAYLAAGLFLHLTYVRYFWMMLALAAAAARITAQAATPALTQDPRP